MSQLKAGIRTAGRPEGMAPMTSPPPMSASRSPDIRPMRQRPSACAPAGAGSGLEDEFAQRAGPDAVLVLGVGELEPQHLDFVSQGEQALGVLGLGLLKRPALARFRDHLLIEALDMRGGGGELGGEQPDFSVRNGGDMRLALLLVARQPAEERSRDDRDQHPGPARRIAAHGDHDRQGTRRHEERRQMRLADLLQHAPHVGEKTLAAARRDAEELVHLRERDDERRGVGEAYDHRVREEAHQRA
jgi:hypothetical protein